MEFFGPTSFKDIKVEDISMSQSCSADMHVLAVDDSFVDRKVIERLLRISSCKVTVVESGSRALQYLGLDGENESMEINGLKVNLIMTDYSMPGMTGYELLKKIKESSAFRKVPVVVMSSEKILTRINSCLEEGAEEFLLKPVKLADVKRLRDYIMGGGVDVHEEESIKRTRQDIDNTESSSTISTLQSPASDSDSSELDTQSSSQSSATSTIKRPRL